MKKNLYVPEHYQLMDCPICPAKKSVDFLDDGRWEGSCICTKCLSIFSQATQVRGARIKLKHLTKIIKTQYDYSDNLPNTIRNRDLPTIWRIITKIRTQSMIEQTNKQMGIDIRIFEKRKLNCKEKREYDTFRELWTKEHKTLEEWNICIRYYANNPACPERIWDALQSCRNKK